MSIQEPLEESNFRVSHTWKSVPYNQNDSVQSEYFLLPHNLEVRFCIVAHRFETPNITVIHVEVEKKSVRPYAEADITITLSDGASKTEQIRDWRKSSSVFCFSNTINGNRWYPDIKCGINKFRFISEEEGKNILNKKKIYPLQNLLFSSLGSDVSIIVENRILHAHKFVIEHFSCVFCAYLKMASDDSNHNILRINNVSFCAMKEVLTFMYTGKFKNEGIATWSLVAEAARIYKIDKLQDYCYPKILNFVDSNDLSQYLLSNNRIIA
ncbi:uncharacterized protein LOC103573544 [Microplitis demolitor]|uniref:uncharacterized protein LOC103573544 n=1 Tax=Microplitis demolitor TaxID=69319 RepID=UPI0004CD3657|nr:uncharacterized protein LOC103573544 [Microplitis demolitor]